MADERIAKQIAEARGHLKKAELALDVLEAIALDQMTPGQQAFRAIKLFTEAWQKRHGGSKYPISGGKDTNLMKDLLKTTDFDTLTGFFPRYFAEREPFVVNGGYTIAIFRSQVPKYLSAQSRTEAKAGHWYDDCAHVPPCANRTQHELLDAKAARA